MCLRSLLIFLQNNIWVVLIFLSGEKNFARTSAGDIALNGMGGNISTYTWNTPSSNSSQSMPCGGGDIGMNVWVENGDLLFYVARSGSFDENNTLLKQGRFRVRFQPNPFSAKNFEQTLHLRNGHMEITSGDVSILIWVDVFKPVIHCSVNSKSRIEAEISYESWRYRDRHIRRGEGQQNSYKWAPPAGLKTTADSIFASNNEVLFYHHNSERTIFDVTAEQQGLGHLKEAMFNPLKNLVSGGKLISKQLVFSSISDGIYGNTDFKAWNFSTLSPTRKLQFSIVLHNGQYKDIGLWKNNLNEIATSVNPQKDRKSTLAWWNSLYDLSFIRMNGEAAHLAHNYRLMRYMLACNARGNYPMKFNGGLFTFDPVWVDSTQAFTPDYRKWGGGTFTAQNQRLLYWPMLKNGDAALMEPQFRFYQQMLPNAELRSRTYWGHEGACFTEQIENYGLPNPTEYGWKRPEWFDKGVEYNMWLEYGWETILEFCQMILEKQSYQGSDISEYLPLIRSSLRFFVQHYRYRASQRGRRDLDGNGKLVLYPASACETYKMAYNPVSTIAGLRRVLTTIGDPDSLLKFIPEFPYRMMNGKKMISPAQWWERVNNTESPQLYPVFPWRFYGVGQEGIETARNTYLHDPDVQKFKSHVGWKQHLIWAACLGLTEEAKALALLKMGDGPHRFPAFFGPGFDWTPDLNHGGSGMIGMQEMLMHTSAEGKITLFAAWPREWNVHFKLHAPEQTVVEASLINGRITLVTVTPESRRKDVALPEWK